MADSLKASDIFDMSVMSAKLKRSYEKMKSLKEEEILSEDTRYGDR